MSPPRCWPLVLLLWLPVALARADGIWMDRTDILRLPTRGAAWEAVQRAAAQPVLPNLSDQEDMSNVLLLARALLAVRLDDARLGQQVVSACRAVMGTEEGGRTLSLGRELAAYVIAADLVGLPEELDRKFRTWLAAVRHRELDGRTLVSTHKDRPNNWGAHAGASRLAIALYLGERDEVERAARVFRGYLGERAVYTGFRYGKDLSWQADPLRPVGINPAGATRHGSSVDGVLPDDQRRGGPFRWPPPQENYVYEGLQGVLVQAVLLSRVGYDVWQWQDRALLRAFRWLHREADFPAKGDDTWQPHLINHFYGTQFPAPVPSRPGKNMGWTDWTHGPGLE